MNQNDIRATKKFIAKTMAMPSFPNENLHFSDEECKVFFDSIAANPFTTNHFYFALKLPSYTIPFQHNLQSFFGKEINTLEHFLACIHPDYIGTFLEWAKSAHLMLASHPEYLVVLDTAYKIMVPLQNADGVYYWVLQESYPLQVSKDNQMLGQFNSYTVTYRYNANHPQEVIGWISGKIGLNSEQDGKLKQFYNKISNFSLTSKEKALITLVHQHNNISYKELGVILDIVEETIKKHTKNITKKVKYAFPHHFPKEKKVLFKSVVAYLHQLEFNIREDNNESID